MKKFLMSALGCLPIIASGFVLALLLSLVPVGYSDAEIDTIGRKLYRGIPWPYYVAQGVPIMYAFGQWLIRLPVNAWFWSVVVAFVSCIPGRKIRWRRIIAVAVVHVLLVGACLVYFIVC